MIEYSINKLFSIIMKVSEKFSYTLKKMREKEIKLYHFIKIKFSLICFRLMQNKIYVCFSGAGVIIESLRMRAFIYAFVFAVFMFCCSPSYAIVNSCCGYLNVGDITVYNRIAAGWTPYAAGTFKYYNNTPTPCTLNSSAGGRLLIYGQVRCSCTQCEYSLSCVSPYYWSLQSYVVKTSISGTVLYTFTLNPFVIDEYYIYACRSGYSTNPKPTPLFTYNFTYSGIDYQARMVTKAVYDNLEKDIYYPYLPKCVSFVPSWGTGTQTDVKQKGAHRKYLGTRKKGIGGYEKSIQ